MSYTVTEISLAPIAGVHAGAGTHIATNWVVDPVSVPGAGPLAFTGYTGEVTTLLFAIADDVVPNWFGVAVPDGLTDFTHAHIFFHPTPAQAQYVDGDYKTKSGKWPELFYYMERLGYQMDGAHRGQVLIMPFLTEARTDAGILPDNWQDIVQQILTQVRGQLNPADNSPLSLAQLVVSSFSAGIIYSDSFRRRAAGLDGTLAEIWDLDGRFSTYHSISEALHSTPGVTVTKYDQVVSADDSARHVPLGRWQSLPNPPTSNADVHALIRDFMFLDGAFISAVGPSLAEGPVPTTGTHTATHAITATHTGTVTQSWGTASATHTGGSTATASHASTATHTATGAHTGTASHTVTATHASTASASHSGTLTHTWTATHAVTSTQTHLPSTLTFGPSPQAPAPSPRAPAQPAAPALHPSPAPLVTPTVPATPAVPRPVAPQTPAAPTEGGTGPGPAWPPPGASCNTAPIAITAIVAANAHAALTALTAIARTRGPRAPNG